MVSLGRPRLKNISQRFSVYELLPEQSSGLRHTLRVQRLKLSRRVGTAHLTWVAAVLGLLVGAIVALQSPAFLPLITQAEPALPLSDKPSIVVLPFV